jgi:hypothetical protein
MAEDTGLAGGGEGVPPHWLTAATTAQPAATAAAAAQPADTAAAAAQACASAEVEQLVRIAQEAAEPPVGGVLGIPGDKSKTAQQLHVRAPYMQVPADTPCCVSGCGVKIATAVCQSPMHVSLMNSDGDHSAHKVCSYHIVGRFGWCAACVEIDHGEQYADFIEEIRRVDQLQAKRVLQNDGLAHDREEAQRKVELEWMLQMQEHGDNLVDEERIMGLIGAAREHPGWWNIIVQRSTEVFLQLVRKKKLFATDFGHWARGNTPADKEDERNKSCLDDALALVQDQICNEVYTGKLRCIDDDTAYVMAVSRSECEPSVPICVLPACANIDDTPLAIEENVHIASPNESPDTQGESHLNSTQDDDAELLLAIKMSITDF